MRPAIFRHQAESPNFSSDSRHVAVAPAFVLNVLTRSSATTLHRGDPQRDMDVDKGFVSFAMESARSSTSQVFLSEC